MKHLTNENLISKLKDLVSDERRITAKILELLREVERRRLFAELGYSSLYDFCTRELKYSEGSTHRRISAMRLLRELPVLESKIASGSLSLSVVSKAQGFFVSQKKKAKPISIEQKLEILGQLESLSARDCEKLLLRFDPEMVRKDQERQVTETQTELRLTVGGDFVHKVSRLKDILSHRHPVATTKEILEIALDFMISKTDPMVDRSRNQLKKSSNAPLPSTVGGELKN